MSTARQSSVLVTGARGFVGRALCQRLVREARTVKGVSRQPVIRAPDGNGVGWVRLSTIDGNTPWEAGSGPSAEPASA